METKDSDTVRFVVNLPKDLHYKLKVRAAQENTTIKDILVKCATDYLDNK